ncbi:putative leucine-rich repeat domain superfamily [Helianthus anomalus]
MISNRFCGTIPKKFKNLKILFELDINNRFVGIFPHVVLKLPKLKFSGLWFNEFEGNVPKELFDKDLDAIFINEIIMMNNGLRSCVRDEIGLLSNVTVFDVSFNELMGSLQRVFLGW